MLPVERHRLQEWDATVRRSPKVEGEHTACHDHLNSVDIRIHVGRDDCPGRGGRCDLLAIGQSRRCGNSHNGDAIGCDRTNGRTEGDGSQCEGVSNLKPVDDPQRRSSTSVRECQIDVAIGVRAGKELDLRVLVCGGTDQREENRKTIGTDSDVVVVAVTADRRGELVAARRQVHSERPIDRVAGSVAFQVAKRIGHCSVVKNCLETSATRRISHLCKGLRRRLR